MRTVHRSMRAKGWDTTTTGPLAESIARLERSALAFAAARDKALSAELPKATRERANRSLLAVERAFARPTGLKGRAWYRSLIYASDVDNGYSTMSFPGVNEAVRAGDLATTTSELADLTARFGVAADAVDEAARALQAAPSAPARR